MKVANYFARVVSVEDGDIGVWEYRDKILI